MNLRRLRARLQDIKTAPVAEATGLHPNTIRKVRRGGMPSFDTFSRLVAYFENESQE